MMLRILFLNEKPLQDFEWREGRKERGICHPVGSKSEEGKGLKGGR